MNFLRLGVLTPLTMLAAGLALSLGTTPGVGYAATSDVQVNISEWQLKLKNTGDASPGQVTFEVHNNGQYTHAFEIDQNGKKVLRSRKNIPPGQSLTVTASLDAGKYDLYCPIDGHRARGIEADVKLTGQGMKVLANQNGGSSGSQSSGGYNSNGNSYSY